ncbi:unnamed protein product [Candidula unifasciata]|uniref:Ligatin n=1 Tax=Candidula unifasciata TaxID=100452 RepID=A0A8S3YUM5_9EUPU|nr:unnamed protein product [Candidula unifasciata]
MFLKPFRVKAQTSVKTSDRKKLRADILQQYPKLSEDDVTKLIPNKEEMTLTKINTHGDDNIVLFSVAKNPIFYELFRKFYPTVYTMWQYPDMLPAFRTWPPVFEKLQKGADLMLPGVVPDKEPSPKMFGNLQKGDLVCVTLAGNKSPVALGKALLSGEDMYMSAMRGKGVSVLHIYGDALWEFGDKSQPPVIPEVLSQTESENLVEQTDTVDSANGEVSSKLKENDLPDVDNLQIVDKDDNREGAVAAGNEVEQEDTDSDDEDKDPVAEMDELLNFCFLCAIKSRVKKSDLPLLTGNFLRGYMQPFSPGKQLDLKKSSFKKFSKFLQAKVGEGYITMKQQSKGVDAITEIYKSHLGLRDLKVPEVVEEETTKPSQSEEEVFKPLTFTDVYCVNGATHDLFKDAGLCKGEALLISDVRQLVTDYIKTNNLQHEDNKKLVTLDPILAHIILKPSEGDLDRMNWEQVINRVVGKMQAGIAISAGSDPPVIKKGKLDPIKLEVSMRASSKKVTIVDNLEDYGIDVKAFSKLVQKSVACSCSVVQPEQKNKGAQVLIQGNQISFVANLLIDKYKIPRRYITGMENAPAPKQTKKR